VDEVLAVGDELFQAKCRERFQEFQECRTTIIIVSHGLEGIVKMCQRAMWLHAGHLMAIGAASDVVEEYSQQPIDHQPLPRH